MDDLVEEIRLILDWLDFSKVNLTLPEITKQVALFCGAVINIESEKHLTHHFDAITLRENKHNYLLLYNASLPEELRLLPQLHELSHLVLGHGKQLPIVNRATILEDITQHRWDKLFGKIACRTKLPVSIEETKAEYLARRLQRLVVPNTQLITSAIINNWKEDLHWK
jgi:hypothetical protein